MHHFSFGVDDQLNPKKNVLKIDVLRICLVILLLHCYNYIVYYNFIFSMYLYLQKNERNFVRNTGFCNPG